MRSIYSAIIISILFSLSNALAQVGDNTALNLVWHEASDAVFTRGFALLAGVDIDQDGKGEFLAYEQDAGQKIIYLFEATADNTYEIIWQYQFSDGTLGLAGGERGIMVTDIDKDGRLEIVVIVDSENPATADGFDAGHIFEWDGTDNGIPSTPTATFDPPRDAADRVALEFNSLAMDLDGDGEVELVLQHRGGNGKLLTIIELTSSDLSIGVTMTVEFDENFTLPGSAADTARFQAKSTGFGITDVDQDGLKEIIMFDDLTGFVRVYEGTGTDTYAFVNQWQPNPTNWASGATVKSLIPEADFDNDGVKELYLSDTKGNSWIITPNGDVATMLDDANWTRLIDWKIGNVFNEGGESRGGIIGDVDLDGKPDIYFAGNNFGSILDIEYDGGDVTVGSNYSYFVTAIDANNDVDGGHFARPINIRLTDMDNDGHLEVVAIVPWSGGNPVDNLLGLYVFEHEASAAVTFQVDMSAQVTNGIFDPGTEKVVVGGSFNGWVTTEELSDADGNLIYTVTLAMDTTLIGTIIEYGYVIVETFLDRWETGSNRSFTLVSGGQVLGIDVFNSLDDISFTNAGFAAEVFYDGISRPDGIAVVTNDTLLVVNEAGKGGIGVYRIARGDQFSPADSFSTIGAPFNNPDDILLHPDGTVFVADGQAQTVFKIPSSGGVPVSFVNTTTTGSGNFNPFGVTVAPAGFDGVNVDPGDLIIADNANGNIDRAVWAVNPTTGVATAIAQGAVFADGPLSLAFGPDGTLYIFENFAAGTSRIVTLGADGTVTPFLTGITARAALAVHPVSGDLYFKNIGGEIHRVPNTGGTPESFATGIEGYQDLTFNADGTILFLSSTSRFQVIKITGPFTTNNPGNLIVTNLNDSGAGSLREKIGLANSNAGPDTIVFEPSLFGGTIQPLSELPTLTADSTTINGDIDGNGTPDIEINGTNTGASVGLFISGSFNTINGLVINRFGVDGIRIDNGHNNLITGNYIGTNSSGTSALPNGGRGIVIQNGATQNVIGGASPAARNLISGNSGTGVFIINTGTKHNRIIGNFIGTNVAGTAALGNGNAGIRITDDGGAADSNFVGGSAAGERNIISGNGVSGTWPQVGLMIETDGNVVKGNYIGTDVTGTVALGNGWNGIELSSTSTANIIGGPGAGDGNLISFNTARGVSFNDSSHGNRVEGNTIGTDSTGTIAQGNLHNGVWIGNDAWGIDVIDNLISGNSDDGVDLSGSHDNVVTGNKIGTDRAGTAALGNANNGVLIRGGALDNTIGGSAVNLRNVIAFNGDDGVKVDNSTTLNNTITRNSIFKNDSLGINLTNGGNSGINAPVLVEASYNRVVGTAPANSTVEVFADSSEEAKYFLGSVLADDFGTWVFEWEFPEGLNIAATATDPDGNTSEIGFLTDFVPRPPAQPVVANIPDITFPEDSTFTLDLDDFVTDSDTPDSLITWYFTVVGASTTEGGEPKIDIEEIVRSARTKNSAVRSNTAIALKAKKTSAASGMGEYQVAGENFTGSETADAAFDELAIKIDSLTHVVTFTPVENWSGEREIIFIAIDDQGLSGVDNMSATVSAVNDAPVLSQLPDLSFSEDVGSEKSLSDWFDRVDDVDDADPTLSWSVSGGDSVTALVSGDTVVFSSPLDWFGNDTLLVIVTDGFLSDSSDLFVTVNAVNDPPVVGDIPDIVFLEEDTVHFDLDSLVTDVDDDTSALVWSVSLAAGDDVSAGISDGGGGMLFVIPQGKMTQPATQGFKRSFARSNSGSEGSADRKGAISTLSASGGDSVLITIDPLTHEVWVTASLNFNVDAQPFIFTATDTSGGTDTDTMRVTVLPDNDPPVLTQLPDLSFNEDEGLELTFSFWFDSVEDPDNADSTLSWSVSGGDSVTISVSGDTVVFSSPLDWFGNDTLLVIVSDGEFADSSDLFVVVESVNDLPIIAVEDTSFLEDEIFIWLLDSLVSDVDHADSQMTWSAEVLHEEESLSATVNSSAFISKIFSRISSSSIQRGSIRRLSDGGNSERVNISARGGKAKATRRVKTIKRVDTVGGENSSESPVFKKTANNSAKKSFAFGAVTHEDEPIKVSVDNDTRILTITATADWNGSREVVLTVVDEDGASAVDTIEVTVLPVGDLPVVNLPPGISFLEDSTHITLDLDDYVTDIDTKPEDISWAVIPEDTSGPIWIDIDDSTHQVFFEADDDWYGQRIITFIAWDPDSLWSMDSLLVVVSPVNDPPDSVELISPAPDDVAIQSDSTQFSWHAVFDPDLDDVINYTIQFSETEDFPDSTINSVEVGADTNITLTELPLNLGRSYWRVEARDLDGAKSYSEIRSFDFVTSVVAEGELPSTFELAQNYPNPFNPATTIEYSLPKAGDVLLVIYNLRGEEVARLVDAQQQAGYQKVIWNASNVASGVYFYRIQAGDFIQTRKMIMLK